MDVKISSKKEANLRDKHEDDQREHGDNRYGERQQQRGCVVEPGVATMQEGFLLEHIAFLLSLRNLLNTSKFSSLIIISLLLLKSH